MAHPQAERMLSGQSAIVTGSGSGLGEAAAIALADAGARVIVTDLPSKLDHAQRVVWTTSPGGCEGGRRWRSSYLRVASAI